MTFYVLKSTRMNTPLGNKPINNTNLIILEYNGTRYTSHMVYISM